MLKKLKADNHFKRQNVNTNKTYKNQKRYELG